MPTNLPPLPSLAAVGIFILSLIQIAPIKVNPWSWLGREIGKAIGIDGISRKLGDMEKRINNLEIKIDEDLKQLKKDVGREVAKTRAKSLRSEIIDAAEKYNSGKVFSTEKWCDIGRWIDEYEKLIEEWSFKNSQCVAAMTALKEGMAKAGVEKQESEV